MGKEEKYSVRRRRDGGCRNSSSSISMELADFLRFLLNYLAFPIAIPDPPCTYLDIEDDLLTLDALLELTHALDEAVVV